MSEKSSPGSDPIPSISFSALLTLFFRSLLQAAKDFILFCSRHKILLLLAVVVGVVIGFVKRRTTSSYYKASMIVNSSGTTLKVYGQMLNNLNTLVGSGAYDLLSKALHVDGETARKLTSIEGTNMDGMDLRKDSSTRTSNPFIIQMSILDAGVADSLGNAVIYYFNNNGYLHQLKEGQVRLHKEKLEFLNRELSRMDSLKDAYNRSLAVSKNTPPFYTDAFGPANVYKQSDVYARERVEEGEWLLQRQESLAAIDGVKSSAVSSATNTTRSLLMYTGIFFFAGCLLGAILEVIKKGS